MSIEALERRIGAHTYRVTHLPSKKGRSMLVRLVKMAGPGLGSFVGGVGRASGGASNTETALALGVGEALHDISARLDEHELAAVMDELALYTVVVQSAEVELRLSDIFDDHFAGRYDEMLAWARFCLEVNFRSFFAGSSGNGPLVRLWKVLSALQSPLTSTGTSTGSRPASGTPQA